MKEQHLNPKKFVHEHRYEQGHETHYPVGVLQQPAAYHHIEKAVQDVRYHTEHRTHPELDHAYDDQHDVTPKEYHDHAVLKSFDHPDSRSYEGPIDHGFKVVTPPPAAYYHGALHQ